VKGVFMSVPSSEKENKQTIQPRFSVEDLRELQGILFKNIQKINEDGGDSISLRGVHSALDVILEKNALDRAHLYICVDDCPDYTGAGFNKILFEASLSDIIKLRMQAGYLGKSIIEWRLTIRK
jgi:hypothetical protein